MKKYGATLLFLCAILLETSVIAENWPGWRGPRTDGTSLEKNVPLQWSNTENVLWKTPIPGKGHASPIVWNDRLFLVTCIEPQEQRVLICIDVNTGKVLWQRVVLTAPLERINSLNSYASSTPTTDGQLVYISFLDRDKMFVAAYDFEGNEVWQSRPGPFASVHGYCSSPIIWKDKLIVNGDHDGPAYIVALDKKTGKTIWKTPRPNKTRSYCPPIIRTIQGRNQLILSGSKCVASYDPDTGSQHWIIDGPTEQFAASLVYNGDLLFMTCGYPDLYMAGIRTDGNGNVTDSHIAWITDQDCSYVPSPISFGPYFLVVSDTGILSCLQSDSGKLLWRQRLKGRHSASLISVNEYAYVLSDKGVMTIIRSGNQFDKVAQNELDELTNASPAISNGKIYLRGDKHLFCIGQAGTSK